MEYYDKFNLMINQIFGDDLSLEPPQPQQRGNTLTANRPTISTKVSALDESFVRLGDTYIHLKKYQDALECYREALKINHQNIMAFNRLLVIPSHLTHSKNTHDSFANSTLSPSQIERLAANDLFRQTLIGGYIVLSKSLSQLSQTSLNGIFWAIQNLSSDYFENHGGQSREFGVLSLNNNSYVWMINHCEYDTAEDKEQFPVLLIVTRKEYQSLKKTITLG